MTETETCEHVWEPITRWSEGGPPYYQSISGWVCLRCELESPTPLSIREAFDPKNPAQMAAMARYLEARGFRGEPGPWAPFMGAHLEELKRGGWSRPGGDWAPFMGAPARRRRVGYRIWSWLRRRWREGGLEPSDWDKGIGP